MHCDRQRSADEGRVFDIALSTDTTRAGAVLTGELDIAGAGRLQAALDGLRHSGHLDVTLDMSGLDFLDAAGLGVLVRAHGEFGAADGRVVLTRLQPRHRRLLALTELDGVLPIE